MIGMVRKVDELGRIVIPKEMRRILNIKTGSSVEIVIEENNSIVLKKFSQISNLHTFAEELSSEIYDLTNSICIVCDEDFVISSRGGNKRDFAGKKVSVPLHKEFVSSSEILGTTKDYPFTYIFPISCDGYVNGYALVLCMEKLNEENKKSVRTLCSFFSRLLSI